MLWEQPQLLEGPTAPKVTEQVCSHPGAAEMGQKGTQTKLLHRLRNPAQLETGLKYSPGAMWVVEAPGEVAWGC